MWSVLSMPANLSSFKVISGNCEQCGTDWWYEGWDSGRWYKAYISLTKPELCKQCLDAQKYGEYRYRCRGCGLRIRGQLEDLREFLRRSFCGDCIVGYYGRYNPENPALVHVLAARAVRRRSQRNITTPKNWCGWSGQSYVTGIGCAA
jgi:hypothetical protein